MSTHQDEVLSEIAAWLADEVGYPVQMQMPDAPAPGALIEALVDHVHRDTGGRWHGGELTHDEVRSWLLDEMGARGDQ